MIKSPFCGAYKIIILGHNHLCLTAKFKINCKTKFKINCKTYKPYMIKS